MKSPPRYFAYGSNMNARRMAERGLATLGACAAIMPDHRLVFDKQAAGETGVGHANVLRSTGSRVEGVLYELASEVEIFKMDPFERAPVNYTREVVCLQTADGPQWAWTYFANRAVRNVELHPSDAYLGHLLAGAAYLSAGYQARLRERLGRLP